MVPAFGGPHDTPQGLLSRALSAPARRAAAVLNPDAAGIAIGATEHRVAVPPDRALQPVRRFGTCTADLDDLADWLLDCTVTSVAMESTGVYWIPLFARLESRGLPVILIDPRQAKRAPGRPKTDVLDCQGLQRLHAYRLLAGAFRPDDHVGVLRGSLRHRHMRSTDAARHIQHMQKALELMPSKRTEAVSDLTGGTGMALIKALVAGERAPLQLATLRARRCKQDETQIARALQGTWRHEHLFALQQAVDLSEFSHHQLAVGDQQMHAHLATFADQSNGQPLPSKPRQRGKRPTNRTVTLAPPGTAWPVLT